MDMNEIDEIASKEIQRLSDVYQIPVPHVYTKWDERDNRNGYHTYQAIDENLYDLIFINAAQMKTSATVLHTVRHEFRHIWQNYHFPIEAAWWYSWSRTNDSFYWFSVMELDANRFANSNCKIDDANFIIEYTANAYGKNNTATAS